MLSSDAENAINLLNRDLEMKNIKRLFVPSFTALENAYAKHNTLYVNKKPSTREKELRKANLLVIDMLGIVTILLVDLSQNAIGNVLKMSLK